MQPNYHGLAPGAVVTAAMETLGLTSRGVQQLLGNRTSDSLIRLWRTNRRRPPQWAVDLLATEIERDTARRTELARMLRLVAGPGRHNASIAPLIAYRAHRAAQKERAGD